MTTDMPRKPAREATDVAAKHPERRPETDSGSGTDVDGETTVRRLPVWQQSLIVVVAAIILAIVVKALFVQVFTVPSASMEPTIGTHDKIVVAKTPYWFGAGPSRGDVVVFKDPGGWLGNSDRDHTTGFDRVLSLVGLYPSGGHLVKRVIGVGGDTVTCCDLQHRIQVNGYSLEEKDYTTSTFPDGTKTACAGPQFNSCAWTSGVIPQGKVFVLGDNRGDSDDSSVHLQCQDATSACTDSPFVSDSLIVGKVVAIGWPLGHFSWLSRPDDFSSIPDPG